MRINQKEKTAIVNAVKKIDDSAKIWLFGSRADDSQKGGDIDIAVLSDIISRKNKLRRKFMRKKIFSWLLQEYVRY
jgi:predicted nucleotidyltransferase